MYDHYIKKGDVLPINDFSFQKDYNDILFKLKLLFSDIIMRGEDISDKIELYIKIKDYEVQLSSNKVHKYRIDEALYRHINTANFLLQQVK
eukprot:CAMPEP_0116935972 /NCGR_PEP_ID=MMETSP0467-20121206/30606_1 /TAXON_ID=283647 /ORGANISM="Mesodinium pulex, Strain SPMC105" /LENGTH=90 /DNA_ID=CAMNT_0004617457 /DNA_START=356 /DNA_END=628 /DNA_ORIENTATION=+